MNTVSDDPQTAGSAGSKAGRENSGVRILIVEDSPTQAQKLRFVLEERQFEVIWTENGRLALEYLETERPEIIITDVIMPEMDGFELCARVKEKEAIPIILLTTLSDPNDILKGLDSGADSFITKPWTKEHLLTRIDYILANARLRELSAQASTAMGLEIFFGGKKYNISAERMQIIDLLFSTYEGLIQKNAELEKLNKELKAANAKIKSLSGLIPICSYCKKIRNDDGFWQQVEVFVAEHSGVAFSHGLCPDCVDEFHSTSPK